MYANDKPRIPDEAVEPEPEDALPAGYHEHFSDDEVDETLFEWMLSLSLDERLNWAQNAAQFLIDAQHAKRVA